MITLHDLDTAIAKCQGESHPDASTCIKLAAFYTIKDAMFGKPEPEQAEQPQYSYATAPEQAENTITYDSGSEFSEAIFGRPSNEVWAIMDELLSVLQATNQRLYEGVLRKIDRI